MDYNLIFAVVAGVASLLVLILLLKIHAFIALLIASIEQEFEHNLTQHATNV